MPASGSKPGSAPAAGTELSRIDAGVRARAQRVGEVALAVELVGESGRSAGEARGRTLPEMEHRVGQHVRREVGEVLLEGALRVGSVLRRKRRVTRAARR